MKKSFFITFEGPDGSGKTTQINNIRSFFEERGFETVVTREPGGTNIGEKIRDILLDRDNSEMDHMTEALLYAASRAQHVSEVILPALEQGKIVICDRFTDSSYAYQEYGRKLGRSIEVINEYAVNGCIPDITFLMELSPDEGMKRIESSVKDRLEAEKMDFHERVFEGYRCLSKRFPDRIKTVDASMDIESISMTIRGYLLELLGRKL